MKIAVGADHAGFKLKEELKGYLKSKGHELIDVGCNSEERCDYPDYAAQVAKAVAGGKAERGVLVCGSGIGMCMTANRVAGVRAAVLRLPEDAKLSREHNDANIACLGGRINPPDQAKSLLEIFLNTAFEGGRHVGRIKKMEKWAWK